MRPTYAQEIVFEGTLEARVAAQLLTDAGRADLLADVTPPINNPSIGRMEFMAQLGNEQNGRGDMTEYTCPPSASVDIIQALAQAAEITRPGQPTLSRKKYMGQKLVAFKAKLDGMESQAPKTGVAEVGGITFAGVSEEQAALLKRREVFVNQFLAERGWDGNNLTLEQLLELREQPGWQNPPAI